MDTLAPTEVQRFYDSFGSKQDKQGYYEDTALDRMVEFGDFTNAENIVEFGYGTGRLARRLLQIAPAARYIGFDISTTMQELAINRVADVADRAIIHLLAPGSVDIPLADRSADRVVSTYVLELLPDAAIDGFLATARRILKPDGLLCLVSLSHGKGIVSRSVSAIWTMLFRLRPTLVGGCRPIDLERAVVAAGWRTLQHARVTRWGITSAVIVAGQSMV